MDMMPEQSAGAREQDEVRRFLNDYARAVRSGDVEKIISFYEADFVAYDMMAPLEFRDLQTYKTESWEKCFTRVFRFPVAYEYYRQTIEVSGDMAYAHGLVHMVGTMLSGKEVKSWMRNTTGMKRTLTGWRIVHEHNSVPVDEQGKAIMNMAPEKSVQ